MELGLERIYTLLERLNNPQDRLKVVHVAGTNGKGSVCAYITSVLLEAGYKVGRFNSPHLIVPHDSIQINGQMISKEIYDRTIDKVETINQQYEIQATSFEILVGATLWLFDQEQLDIVVIEVGLGGSKDATNVFQHPIMTIITSIGWDHMGVLGHSIQEIAKAKAGIMKPSCPVVIAPQTEKNALLTLIDHAHSLNIDCIVMPKAIPFNEEKNMFSIDQQQHQYLQLILSPENKIHPESSLRKLDYQYSVSLQGDYQQENSATAIMALEWLDQLGYVELTQEIIKKGLFKTKWPGRLEWVRPPSHISLSSISSMLVDGAHNSPAMKSLRQYVDKVMEKNKLTRVIWIIGVTQGKSIEEMLTYLIHEKGDIIITVPFSQPIGMPWIHCIDPFELANHQNHHTVLPQLSLNDGLQLANSLFDSKSDLVVLCGSLYLVADLYRLLQIG